MLKKTLTNAVSDSLLNKSIPLRKSFNALQSPSTKVFRENDDEAERLALRCDSTVTTSPASNNTSNISPRRRHSLGLSNLKQVPEPQMKEHITHCIKLNAENKINLKNAFSLEIIDFMTFMFTKRKSEITNLQVASVTLDVSTKIYGYRVDSLYSVILKIAGGVDKQQQTNELISNESEVCNENGQVDEEAKSHAKTKKKKNKQKICSTNNALKGNIETFYPSQSIIGSGDSCTSDMLYQAVLPNHAKSGFYYNMYNDVILDVLDDTDGQDKNSSEYTIPVIKNYSNLDICLSFANFKLFNWSQEDEEEEEEEMPSLREENNQSRFHFDLDKSLLPEDANQSGPVDYFDTQYDEENPIPCRKKPTQVENIVDLRNIIATQVSELHKPSEYSFIQKNFLHWAGPSYWKIKPFGKVLGNSKVIAACHHAGVKKKKDTVLNYDLNSTFQKNFSFSKAVKTTYKTIPITWKEKEITLPEDIHYDVLRMSKLHLRPLIVKYCSENEDQSNEAQVPGDENDAFNNEHDISDYCADIATYNEEIQERNDFDDLKADNATECQMPFTGNNLVVAPQLTQKVLLSYSSRAKKIDMRQLKQTIWKSLTSESDNENKDTKKSESQNVREIKEPKPFSTVYKSLSNTLSKMNAEALSLPIAFISLLHLANEKSLKLTLHEDMSDFIVDKDSTC